MAVPKEKESKSSKKSRLARWLEKAKKAKDKAISHGKSIIKNPSSYLKNRKNKAATEMNKIQGQDEDKKELGNEQKEAEDKNLPASEIPNKTPKNN
uniref:Ribosomal protein L32 n=1 Tax=Protohalopteris sp. TaxID=2843287 RepID=A0A8F0F765_9PHAE|nr:ribosomal protein L32 [Protohalopteris sp.]